MRTRLEHGLQLVRIHWIIEKKNKTRKGEVFIAKIGRVKVRKGTGYKRLDYYK
jgi:hypothetical protein